MSDKPDKPDEAAAAAAIRAARAATQEEETLVDAAKRASSPAEVTRASAPVIPVDDARTKPLELPHREPSIPLPSPQPGAPQQETQRIESL
ncbi:MAG TPA: hypothetical protein VLT45_10145, partial [Kofleriaceae bacterium]|nr:hypothetical protein [Kofleriaceae bacterium]